MTILDKILRQKEKEVALLRKQDLKNIEPVYKQVPKVFETFRDSNELNVIAEMKRASPSKGAINLDVDPVTQVKEYGKFGAGAISVLTDKTFFQGSMDDLRAVHEAVNLPILCKEFIIDKCQIDLARASGANLILLIVAALPESKLCELFAYAQDLGLEVLCEVHNEAEMTVALNLGAKIIGINNRNLKTFEVDLGVTGKLASMVTDSDTILISESGLKSADDVLKVRDQGAAGILIGETLMRSKNLAETFQSLRIPRLKGGIPNAR